MRILLLGEYSNVHATLAQGLRALGHTVVVASDGDSWKNYPRDIDLCRRPGFWGRLSFAWRLLWAMPKFRGFDVVQLINPLFFELKASSIRPLYHYLRKHNRAMVMGAFGMDYYWVQVNSDIRPMRYSDFNLGEALRHDAPAERERKDWIGTDKERLNREIALDCDAIVACLYEYLITYQHAEEGALSHKTQYIPLPIQVPIAVQKEESDTTHSKIKIFVGISKNRSVYKGTDVMLRAAQDLQKQYPDQVELIIAEGVPYDKYQRLLEGADLVLDQLYSYTPAMNALLAMSKGVITVGGGEEEHYALLQEKELRPIVNVEPDYQSVYEKLEELVLHPERIVTMKRQSVEFVHRHHDYIQVAKAYSELYQKVLCKL